MGNISGSGGPKPPTNTQYNIPPEDDDAGDLKKSDSGAQNASGSQSKKAAKDDKKSQNPSTTSKSKDGQTKSTEVNHDAPQKTDKKDTSTSQTKQPPTELDTKSTISQTTGQYIAPDKQTSKKPTTPSSSENSQLRNQGISLDPAQPALAQPTITKEAAAFKTKETAKILRSEVSPIKIANVAATPNPQAAKIVEGAIPKLVAISGIKDPKNQYLLIQALMSELGNKLSFTLMEKSRVDAASSHKDEQKYFDAIAKREKARQKSKSASIFKKIFKWLGAILTLIAAIILQVLATVASVVTLGAATPLAVAAGFLMAAAIMGIVVLVLEETGAMQAIIDKAIAPMFMAFGMSEEKAKMAAGIFMAVLILVAQIVLAVLSAAASGGASTAGSVTSIMTTINRLMTAVEAVNTISQAVITIGDATAQAIQSTANYETAKAEKQSLDVKQSQENRTFSQDEVTELLRELQKIIAKMAKDTSTFIQQDMNTMSNILGRIGNA